MVYGRGWNATAMPAIQEDNYSVNTKILVIRKTSPHPVKEQQQLHAVKLARNVENACVYENCVQIKSVMLHEGIKHRPMWIL